MAPATAMNAQRLSCTLVNGKQRLCAQAKLWLQTLKSEPQVPSNMALVRVGGALWLGVIVTLWGIVATCFAGLSSATMCASARVISCAGRTSDLRFLLPASCSAGRILVGNPVTAVTPGMSCQWMVSSI